MKYGTYVGPVAALRGKTALLRENAFGGLLAQFDDHTLQRGDTYLGFGWHPFENNEFRVDSPAETIDPRRPSDAA